MVVGLVVVVVGLVVVVVGLVVVVVGLVVVVVGLVVVVVGLVVVVVALVVAKDKNTSRVCIIHGSDHHICGKTSAEHRDKVVVFFHLID